MLLRALDAAAIPHPGTALPTPIRLKSGTNGKGRPIHYLLNYSSDAQHFPYPLRSGTDLLTGKPVATNATLDLAPWDLAIVQEN